MFDASVLAKLQVKGGRRLAVVGVAAPTEGVAVEDADVALVFVANRAEFDARLLQAMARLRPEAILWVAYPKLTSKLAADLNRDVIREAAPSYGLDTVSQIALDADWSALRLKRVAP